MLIMCEGFQKEPCNLTSEDRRCYSKPSEEIIEVERISLFELSDAVTVLGFFVCFLFLFCFFVFFS